MNLSLDSAPSFSQLKNEAIFKQMTGHIPLTDTLSTYKTAWVTNDNPNNRGVKINGKGTGNAEFLFPKSLGLGETLYLTHVTSQLYRTRISGPYRPKILKPAVGLDLLASLAKRDTWTQAQPHLYILMF